GLIKFDYDGANSISLGGSDELIINTDLDDITQPQATAFQIDANGNKVTLGWQPDYDISGTEVSFDIGSYNSSLDLVIQVDWGQASNTSTATDNLEWSSYIGGTGHHEFTDVTTDVSNNVYITGYTTSTNFPTASGQFSTSYEADYDGIVMKLDDNLVHLWSAYIGGAQGANINFTGGDFPQSIGTTTAGDFIYICGWTFSSDFPTKKFGTVANSYEDATNSCTTNCKEIFISRFESSGTLVWSTYYGEDGDEIAYDLVVDGQNNLYVVGVGNSNTLTYPKTGASNYTTGNGLILKFNNLTERDWITKYNVNEIKSVDVDANNNLFITGNAGSGLLILNYDVAFPSCTTNQGGKDVFISKFNTTNALAFSMYLGGSDDDLGNGITTDNLGNVILCGYSESSDYINKDYDSNNQNDFCDSHLAINDAIITKLSNTGTILWSTYYGTGQNDEANNLTTDINGSIYIGGYTQGGTPLCNPIPMPTTNPANCYVKSDKAGIINIDGFFACFNSVSELTWATYFGGEYIESVYSLCVSNSDKLYVTGSTNTNNQNVTNSNWEFPIIEYDQSTNSSDYYQEIFTSGSFWIGYAARFDLMPIYILNNNEKLKKSNSLNIFPNPVEDYLSINCNTNDFYDVQIFDITGKLLYINKQLAGLNRINIKNYPSGVYIIELITKDGINKSKIIKL
ncbi:SBBP repeat-containing protein, partial [Bacteroidota bacterium]